MSIDIFSSRLQVNEIFYFILECLVGSGHSALPTIKGRLLTSQEGCGYSKVLTKRIIGGAPAKNGAYPWMSLLRFNRSVLDSNDYIIGYEPSFDCGKLKISI